MLLVLLVAIGSARIAATYTVFNHTIDEPAHIACGMQWLDQHVYRYETQHPPLARVMTAIGPYLAGERSHGRPEKYNEGAAILYTSGHYDRTLALARLGILPFFWLAAWVVYWWTKRGFGEPAALLATGFFTFLPPVLAHAGLATTDMALTATFGAAFVAMLAWLEKPSWGRSAWFGIATAAAVLSKFSVLAFFPAAALAALIFYIAIERPGARRMAGFIKPRIMPLTVAVAIAAMAIAAMYRFTLADLFSGIEDVIQHNRAGHPAYLLGQYSESGWWYYYPVVLAVKTPLALLALVAIGAAVCWRRRREKSAYWMPLAFALGILIFGAFSRINIGVRHVLPVYFAFSTIAAVGAMWLWARQGYARWILGGLMLWMAASSALSHPDYLAYFNALAGDEPEKVLVDSDLDWGQDMKRLGARLQEVGAKEVAFDPFIVAYLEKVHGFPPIHPLNPEAPRRAGTR